MTKSGIGSQLGRNQAVASLLFICQINYGSWWASCMICLTEYTLLKCMHSRGPNTQRVIWCMALWQPSNMPQLQIQQKCWNQWGLKEVTTSLTVEYLGCVLATTKLKGGRGGGSSVVLFPFSLSSQNLSIQSVVDGMFVSPAPQIYMLKPWLPMWCYLEVGYSGDT